MRKVVSFCCRQHILLSNDKGTVGTMCVGGGGRVREKERKSE